MSAEILFWLASVFASAAFAWNFGYKKGRASGVAVGWNEHYTECVERDRARRQRNGQFKEKAKA